MPAGGQPYQELEAPSLPAGGGGGPAPAARGGAAPKRSAGGGAIAKVAPLLQALRAAPPEEFSQAMQELAAGVQQIAQEKFGGQAAIPPQDPAAMGPPTAVPSGAMPAAPSRMPLDMAA